LSAKKREDYALNRLLQAVELSDIDKITSLINPGPIRRTARLIRFKKNAVLNSVTEAGEHVMHVAIAAGDEDVLDLLHGMGASLEVPSKDGEGLFLLACRQAQPGSLEWLISRDHIPWGAIQGDEGAHALRTATSLGHTLIVKTLLQSRADPNATTSAGVSALHIAASGGRDQIIKSLCALRGDPNLARAKDGAKPVHLASQNGHVWAVQQLLNSQADVHALDQEGSNALEYAALNGKQLVVEWLLAVGVDPNAGNRAGMTGLYCAAQGGHLDCVVSLLEAKADIDKVCDSTDETAVDAASRNGYFEVEEYLKKHGAKSSEHREVSNWVEVSGFGDAQEHMEIRASAEGVAAPMARRPVLMAAVPPF